LPRHVLTTTSPDPLIAALADRLPAFEPRATFPAVLASLRGVRGIPGRNDLYAFLRSLDGSHLSDDLILRIADHDRATRRSIVVRPRVSWGAQRDYLRRFRALDGAHPPRPISYKAAHARVRAERGPASALTCGECGDRAAEWSYSGFSPDEQVGWVTASTPDGVEETLRLWSPVPSDYEALCRRCHWERDESGALWTAPPAPKPAPVPAVLRTGPALPADAPAWVHAIAEPEARTR